MNKIVIVTGATSGIGKAIAEKFISDGDKIIAIGRNNEKLKTLQHMYPENCEVFKTDVSKAQEVQDLFKIIKLNYSNIDILVNVAGITKPVSTKIPFAEAVENWDSVIGTNLRGAFMMSIEAAPLLKKNKGRIINISSLNAATGGASAGGLAYAASKAGMNGLTYGLARELSKDGITVNSIAPGFIENTGYTSTFTSDKIQKIVNNVPMNRAGTVYDIAETCFFLCSENASYITGQIINVNGGLLFGR